MKEKNKITLLLGLILILTLGILMYGTFMLNGERTPREEQSENGEEIIVEPEKQELTVVVFFNKEGETDCNRVFPARREVEPNLQVGTAAIEELLKGPTQEEQAKGYITNIPENVKLNQLSIQDGIATADFTSELNEIAGSCRVQAIRAQIESTLLQFNTVENVNITIEGEREGILQP